MRWLIFLALFFLTFSCVNKDRIPDDIIPRDKMEKVLWDMIQADQYVRQFVQKDSGKLNVNVERIKLYQEVFHIYHTTKEQFQKSYRFYMGRPDLSKSIFDSLNAFTRLERTEVYKTKTNPSPKTALNPADSMKLKKPVIQLPSSRQVVKPRMAPPSKSPVKPGGE